MRSIQFKTTIFLLVLLGLSAGCEQEGNKGKMDRKIAEEVLAKAGVDKVLSSIDTSATMAEGIPTPPISETEAIRQTELAERSELKDASCCEDWMPGAKVAICCCDSLVVRYAYALKTDLGRALSIMEADPYYTACKEGYKKYQRAIEQLENSLE
ncbi:hypothetical protein [Phaeodactylibacter luteus]|uniref:Lipoprotein n=1 Tax=Phaeodactylibacter luteus TaxID=1564516 RepID=A0A5C6S1K7_9BACT|nr:hypothetical protein [Phaeodactylibacter luteus]TXB68304.1 hypothetical protein FRY97_02690 [Phaeodactylibacter luteus]